MVIMFVICILLLLVVVEKHHIRGVVKLIDRYRHFRINRYKAKTEKTLQKINKIIKPRTDIDKFYEFRNEIYKAGGLINNRSEQMDDNKAYVNVPMKVVDELMKHGLDIDKALDTIFEVAREDIKKMYPKWKEEHK